LVESTTGVPVIATVAYPVQSLSDRPDGVMALAVPILAGAVMLETAILLGVAIALPRRAQRERNERIRLLERLITSSDAERRRVAGEVHDGAVQGLVGISFALRAMVNEAPPPLDQRLQGLASATTTAVSSLRSLLTSVYPVDVPADGWWYGLDEMIAALRATGIDVTLDVPPRRSSPLTELLMLRVTLEALRNVAAHSQASQVIVRMNAHDVVRVRLTIADDGVGFDEATARSKREAGHFGLSLMRDLACELGATLDIDSTLGSGTVVTLDIKEDP
jgi:signal transduction histidine kinase